MDTAGTAKWRQTEYCGIVVHGYTKWLRVCPEEYIYEHKQNTSLSLQEGRIWPSGWADHLMASFCNLSCTCDTLITLNGCIVSTVNIHDELNSNLNYNISIITETQQQLLSSSQNNTVYYKNWWSLFSRTCTCPHVGEPCSIKDIHHDKIQFSSGLNVRGIGIIYL